MHRSNTISSFMDKQKSKKLWSNPFSKTHKEISSPYTSTAESKTTIPRSQSSIKISTPVVSSTTSQRLRKRSSLVLPESTEKVSASYKHKSMSIGPLQLDVSKVTDPKELEFYKKLMAPMTPSGTILEDDEDEGEDEQITNEEFIDNSSFSTSHASSNNSQPTTLFTTSTENSSFATSKPQPSAQTASHSLAGALEDYELFTKRQSALLIAPTTPSFSAAITSDNDVEETTLTTSLSLPSLTSLESVDSELSVMKVSNSLWVGIIESDNEEDTKNGLKTDALDGFDAESVFFEDVEDYKLTFNRLMKASPSFRTSLVFA
ncbi:CYFA0S06e04060g1_1 [Cyberlindnera fabianii]|uniref:CYFA0S06e04060g1_1 n=1 Tax=Cyberlindnera fabianii TaxID=36022 RepID=A0A061B2H2_CYBFA|nr:CYFA0S06e04060g1_1 [Cyberlindnera fabianii]